MNISDFNSVACKLNSGELCWGSNAGIIRYNKKYERQHNNAPLFTNTCVRFNDTIILDNENNSLDVLPGNTLKINFGAIDWGHEDKLTYRYCLSAEKGSFEWNETKGNQELFFSEIQPGKYFFYVQAIGRNGNSEILEFSIHFLPKWYQQIIFKIIAILVIVLIVGSYFRHFRRSFRRFFA